MVKNKVWIRHKGFFIITYGIHYLKQKISWSTKHLWSKPTIWSNLWTTYGLVLIHLFVYSTPDCVIVLLSSEQAKLLVQNQARIKMQWKPVLLSSLELPTPQSPSHWNTLSPKCPPHVPVLTVIGCDVVPLGWCRPLHRHCFLPGRSILTSS